MHDIDVKEILLALEEFCAEIPECARVESEHGDAGFVGEGGGRVPWLDLVAEEEFHVGVFGADGGEDRGVERVEHFGGEGADVIEIWWGTW